MLRITNNGVEDENGNLFLDNTVYKFEKEYFGYHLDNTIIGTTDNEIIFINCLMDVNQPKVTFKKLKKVSNYSKISERDKYDIFILPQRGNEDALITVDFVNKKILTKVTLRQHFLNHEKNEDVYCYFANKNDNSYTMLNCNTMEEFPFPKKNDSIHDSLKIKENQFFRCSLSNNLITFFIFNVKTKQFIEFKAPENYTFFGWSTKFSYTMQFQGVDILRFYNVYDSNNKSLIYDALTKKTFDISIDEKVYGTKDIYKAYIDNGGSYGQGNKSYLYNFIQVTDTDLLFVTEFVKEMKTFKNKIGALGYKEDKKTCFGITEKNEFCMYSIENNTCTELCKIDNIADIYELNEQLYYVELRTLDEFYKILMVNKEGKKLTDFPFIRIDISNDKREIVIDSQKEDLFLDYENWTSTKSKVEILKFLKSFGEKNGFAFMTRICNYLQYKDDRADFFIEWIAGVFIADTGNKVIVNYDVFAHYINDFFYFIYTYELYEQLVKKTHKLFVERLFLEITDVLGTQFPEIANVMPQKIKNVDIKEWFYDRKIIQKAFRINIWKI